MKICHLTRLMGGLFIALLFSANVHADLPAIGCQNKTVLDTSRNLASGPDFSKSQNKREKDFLKDTRLSLTLSQTWETTDIDSSYYENHNEEWAQLFTLRLSSGMFMGVAGVDATFFGVMPLGYEEGNTGSTFFQDGEDGYTKTAVALKVSPYKGVLLKAGTMESPHLLLGPGDFRTTPRLYKAGLISYTRSGLSLSYIHAVGVSDYTRETFSDFSVNNGSWSDPAFEGQPVQVGDVTWNKGPVHLNASFGHQQDFMNYTFAEASVAWPKIGPFTIRTDVNYRLKDSIREMHEDLDHSMQMFSGRVVVAAGGAWVSFAASSVEDNTEFGNSIDGTMGVDWWSRDGILAGCKEGGYYTNGVQGTFCHQGEDAFKIEAGYAFPGILDGLALSAYYIQGQDIYAGSEYSINHRQYEWGGRLTYFPPFLKGLRVEAAHGTNNMKSDGEYGMNQDMARTEINVAYTMEIL